LRSLDCVSYISGALARNNISQLRNNVCQTVNSADLITGALSCLAASLYRFLDGLCDGQQIVLGDTMADTRHTKVLIIGSGPAGYAAGVYASRAMLNPILVQGIEPGGQLTTTTEVENWPGDTEVQGPDLMIRMESHAKEMGCEIIGDIISDLDLTRHPFTATGDSGTIYTADAVILATGARAKWLGLPSSSVSKKS